ncbi:MAG: hypothetical protein ABGW82_11905 [Paracoccus sp. (in: a-proteobacteria)]
MSRAVDGEHAAGAQDPPCFAEEGPHVGKRLVLVEVMQDLGVEHEIELVVAELATLRFF